MDLLDPDSDPDPAFQVNPDTIRIHGIDYQKLKEKILMKNFFISKIAVFSPYVCGSFLN